MRVDEDWRRTLREDSISVRRSERVERSPARESVDVDGGSGTLEGDACGSAARLPCSFFCSQNGLASTSPPCSSPCRIHSAHERNYNRERTTVSSWFCSKP